MNAETLSPTVSTVPVVGRSLSGLRDNHTRNRLLRPTANSPELFAVIKAEGRT